MHSRPQGRGHRARHLPLAGALALALGLAPALTATAAPAPQLSTDASAPDSTTDPSLSPTPYMGWNTWYGLGNDVTESAILAQAQALVDTGLADAGYDIVWIDGGWAAPERDTAGNLVGDPAKFPNGMEHLVDEIHALGLRAGIYTDAGPEMPEVCGVASGGGNEQRDADRFAAWGFDAIKIDFVCGWGAEWDPRPAFETMTAAVRNNASGRPMIVNLCNPVTSPYWGDYPEWMQSTFTWSYAPAIAESWRTFTDVGFNGEIKFSDVLRNYDANAAHPEVAGPGHWNDPDYLGPQLSMTDREFRTQMSLWVVAAAPLIIGSRVDTLSQASLDTLLDPEALAINQDPLGDQAELVSPAGEQEVWVKDLADGSKAVVLLNRGDDPAQISTTPAEVGLEGQRVRVEDAWANTSTESNGVVRAQVPGHGAALLTVARATGKPGPSTVQVGPARPVSVDGMPLPASATDLIADGGSVVDIEVPVSNDGTQILKDVQVSLDAPEGWTVQGGGTLRSVPPGATATTSFTITVPDGTPLGTYQLTARATLADRSVTSDLQVTVAPRAPEGRTNLAHHPWVSATSGWMTPTIDRSVGGWSPLRVDGTTYETGIGVASPSIIRYYLGGQSTRLTGMAGIDDAAAWTDQGGTVTFQIVGDGRVLWETAVISFRDLQTFDLDVSGVHDLRLVVTDGGDTTYNDRADWLSLFVE